MTEYPTTIKDMQAELHKYAKVGRADRPFRLAIALAQLGNVAMHMTHDPEENPMARPYGTAASHVSDAGHFLAQSIIYLDASGIDVQEALNASLDAIRDKDCLKRVTSKSKDGSIVGEIGCWGVAKGTAWVDPYMTKINDIDKPQDAILITNHPHSDARLKKFIAVITDQGGIGCHAAIVCRESEIPCIVGTVDATTRIKHGDRIEMDATGNIGKVKIL
jgi:phosphohistidine swiveling domain-containing protein